MIFRCNWAFSPSNNEILACISSNVRIELEFFTEMPLALLSPLLLCETDNCPFCCLILSRYNYIAKSSLLLGNPTWVPEKARSDQELVQLIYLPMIPYEARRRVFISQFLNFQFWDFFSQANFWMFVMHFSTWKMIFYTFSYFMFLTDLFYAKRKYCQYIHYNIYFLMR